LWTYGLADWASRTHDAQVMLKGDPSTLDLLHRYQVDYVVLGPEDAAIQGSNGGYFDQIAERVYSSGGHTGYRVRRGGGPQAAPPAGDPAAGGGARPGRGGGGGGGSSVAPCWGPSPP